MKFRIVGINEVGQDRVNVNLQSVNENVTPGEPAFSNMINLNVLSTDAVTAGYWPGKEFTVTLEPVAP